jgi:hypothetical protein
MEYIFQNPFGSLNPTATPISSGPGDAIAAWRRQSHQ